MLPGKGKHAESHLWIVEGVPSAGRTGDICTLKSVHAFVSGVCVCACVCIHAMILMWKLEDNLSDSVLSFYHMGPRDQFPVSRFGDRHL